MSLALTPLQTIGARGNGPAQFNDPHGIAISSDDRVYVADTGNRRVQVLDSDGNFITALEANNNEKFVEPFDVVIASTGDVLVLDADVGWIYRFDANGRALGRFAGPAAQFYKPRGMAIDSEDNLYIADTGGARIVKLSLNGERLKVFGARGNGRGQFLEPSHVAVDAEGFVFATDVPNKRINVFHPDGRFVADFPIPLANPFNGTHMAFTSDAALLLTAPEAHKIQHYTRDGKLLNEWGNFGNDAGQFRLPTALAVSGDTLWIVDTGNHRIQTWSIK
jgi:DNA-binding beta-propeller fold protein YncE